MICTESQFSNRAKIPNKAEEKDTAKQEISPVGFLSLFTRNPCVCLNTLLEKTGAL